MVAPVHFENLWDTAPHFLIRDNDGSCGEVFRRWLPSMGIRDRPSPPRSPWQNGYVERVTGSIRRECLDYVIVWSAACLQRVLTEYVTHFHSVRTHVGLGKDTPNHRTTQRCGLICSRDVLGGLHHQYCGI